MAIPTTRTAAKTEAIEFIEIVVVADEVEVPDELAWS